MKIIPAISSPAGDKDYLIRAIAAIKNIKPSTLLTIILLFALLLRLYFFVGLIWSDDAMYVNEANEVLKGHFNPDNNLNRRIATYLPIAFFFYYLGINELTASLYALCCSLAEIMLIFYIGKRFFNENIGLISAFLLAVYPLHINYSTVAMGEVPISLLGSLSIFLFLLARENAGRKIDRFVDKCRTWMLFFGGGFIAYLSYLIKELGLLAPLFMLLCFLYDIIKSRTLNYRYAFVLAGFLSACFIEIGIYYYNETIDPFVSFHQGISFFSVESNLSILNMDMRFYSRHMFDPGFIFNLEPYQHNGRFYYNYFGPFFYLVGISSIYLLLKREKGAYKIISWMLVMLLWMQFGTMSYKGYVPMHRLIRHLTIISIPSLLLVSSALYGFITSGGDGGLFPKKVRIFISIAVIFALTVLWMTNLKATTRYERGRSADIKEIYENVKYIDKPVYTGEISAIYLRFLSGFKKDNFRVIHDLKCGETHDSYVVTNAELGWILSVPVRNILPTCVLVPPKHWILIKIIDTDFKEPPYGGFNPSIYYIP